MARKKKLNKEEEKVLLDLIDELIAELDVTYTDANITTKRKVMALAKSAEYQHLLVTIFSSYLSVFNVLHANSS